MSGQRIIFKAMYTKSRSCSIKMESFLPEFAIKPNLVFMCFLKFN